MFSLTQADGCRGKGPGLQIQISTIGGSNSSSLGLFSFNVQSARQIFVKMIVLFELPIQLEMMLLDFGRKRRQILKITL